MNANPPPPRASPQCTSADAISGSPISISIINGTRTPVRRLYSSLLPNDRDRADDASWLFGGQTRGTIPDLLGFARMDANSGKAWSEMDLQDLKASLDYGDTFAAAASFLCRDEDEVRQKAKELGLVAHPGKRTSVRVVKTGAPTRRGRRQ